MNFFKNLFGNKKVSKEEEVVEDKKVATETVEDKKEEVVAEKKVTTEAGAGCDCTECPSSGGCPGEEMKKAVEDSATSETPQE